MVGEKLLGVDGVVTAQPVDMVSGVSQIAGEVFVERTIFVLELVPEDGAGPAPRSEFALIVESRAVQVLTIDKRAVDEEVEAIAVADGIDTKAAVIKIIASQPMLPAGAARQI